jgi:hypothetical protein
MWERGAVFVWLKIGISVMQAHCFCDIGTEFFNIIRLILDFELLSIW